MQNGKQCCVSNILLCFVGLVTMRLFSIVLISFELKDVYTNAGQGIEKRLFTPQANKIESSLFLIGK